jgi:nicotinamidase/pyrazinamidase
VGAAYDHHTALVVVDVQNDFADPGGSLYVQDAPAIIGVVNDAVASARAAGASVIYTQDWHPPSTPHFAKDGGTWPVHCVAGTWGAELHPERVVEGDRVRKGTQGEDGYSGFTMADPTTRETSSTGLAELLHERDVSRVVVVGLATDYCVKATALDGVQLGFSTSVLEEAVRPVELEPGDGERALAQMREAGVAVE